MTISVAAILVPLLTMLSLWPSLAAGDSRSSLPPTNLEHIRQLCARFHDRCDRPWLAERNSDGTELRLVSNKSVLVIPEEGPAVRYEKPALLAWLDDRHVFVAQSKSALEPLFLASGERFDDAAYPQPFDWSRRFLLLSTTDECRVIRVGPPAALQVTVPPPCQRLLSHGHHVHVIGDHRDRTEIVIATFSDDGQRLLPSGVRRLKRPSGRYSPFFVMDISLDGAAFSVRNTYDAPIWSLAPSYILRLSSGSLERQGFSNWGKSQLFLSRHLSERLRKSR